MEEAVCLVTFEGLSATSVLDLPVVESGVDDNFLSVSGDESWLSIWSWG